MSDARNLLPLLPGSVEHPGDYRIGLSPLSELQANFHAEPDTPAAGLEAAFAAIRGRSRLLDEAADHCQASREPIVGTDFVRRTADRSAAPCEAECVLDSPPCVAAPCILDSPPCVAAPCILDSPPCIAAAPCEAECVFDSAPDHETDPDGRRFLDAAPRTEAPRETED